MAIRLKNTLNVFASEDTSGLDNLFGQSDASRGEIIHDTFERLVSGKLSIAASGTEDLPLGDVDVVRGIYMDADRGFNIVFNGGVDIVQVRPGTTGGRCRLFMDLGALTQLGITNIDATSALSAIYCVWGDPSA